MSGTVEAATHAASSSESAPTADVDRKSVKRSAPDAADAADAGADIDTSTENPSGSGSESGSGTTRADDGQSLLKKPRPEDHLAASDTPAWVETLKVACEARLGNEQDFGASKTVYLENSGNRVTLDMPCMSVVFSALSGLGVMPFQGDVHDYTKYRHKLGFAVNHLSALTKQVNPALQKENEMFIPEYNKMLAHVINLAWACPTFSDCVAKYRAESRAALMARYAGFPNDCTIFDHNQLVQRMVEAGTDRDTASNMVRASGLLVPGPCGDHDDAGARDTILEATKAASVAQFEKMVEEGAQLSFTDNFGHPLKRDKNGNDVIYFEKASSYVPKKDPKIPGAFETFDDEKLQRYHDTVGSATNRKVWSRTYKDGNGQPLVNKATGKTYNDETADDANPLLDVVKTGAVARIPFQARVWIIDGKEVRFGLRLDPIWNVQVLYTAPPDAITDNSLGDAYGADAVGDNGEFPTVPGFT